MKYIETVEAFQLPPPDAFHLVPFVEWAKEVGLTDFGMIDTHVLIKGCPSYVKVFPREWIVVHKCVDDDGTIYNRFNKIADTYFQKIYQPIKEGNIHDYQEKESN